MYNKITKEDFNKLFENHNFDPYVIYGSKEFIDQMEVALKEYLDEQLKPSELEQKIIDLREEGYTYKGIQLKLGNPSKKFIKETLKKYRPDLAGDVVANPGKLKNQLYG